jgi:hypothetical protein
MVNETARQSDSPHMGEISSIDQRSSISEREIEDRSIEPVPGGTAKPPATGLEERTAAVRGLVRRLPWADWAKRRETNFRLTRGDADVVQTAICEAMASAGITLDQATMIGQAALGEARSNPVGYVSDAFRKHLPKRLRALEVEPLADEPLPLPEKPTPKLAKSAAAAPGEAEPAPPVLPACSTCGAAEGDPIGYRQVAGADGDREVFCPDCHPEHPARRQTTPPTSSPTSTHPAAAALRVVGA